MSAQRRIGAVDTIWLNMDLPTNLMVIDSILWFDSQVDWARLRTVLERRLIARFPVFSQRPVMPALPAVQPHWEDDPEFSLDRHLIQARLPAPGGQAELRAHVERQLHHPLDRRHPLWQLHLIDGYDGGSAVMTRFHHALADGMALGQVLLSLTDPSADGDQGGPSSESGAEPAAAGHGPFAPAVAAASQVARATHRIGESAGRLVHELPHLVDPSLYSDALSLAVQTGRILDKLLLKSNPPTPLSGTLGVAKLVAWSDARPLADVKRIGHLAGATVNDVLVTAVAAAISTYLIDQGSPAVDLTTMVPVNVRPPGQPLPCELGNQFALVMLELPSGPWPLLQRLAETKRRMDAIKNSPEAAITFEAISTIGHTNATIERLLVDFFADKAFGVTTNVAGPTGLRYLAGTPLAGTLGWVPGSGGQSLGICIYTYNDAVRVGFKVDAGLIPEPDTLVHAFEAAIDDLLQLAGPGHGEVSR